MAVTVLIAYDISEDNRRARVAARLQQWGSRLQRSVFICVIEPEALTELMSRVEEIIDVKTDSIAVLRQCANCWDTMKLIGQAAVDSPRLYWAVM